MPAMLVHGVEAGTRGGGTMRCNIVQLAGVALAALLFTAPAGAEEQRLALLLSAEDEKRIGREEHPKIVAQFGGVFDDAEIGGWIADMGGRLVAASKMKGERFTFTVLDSPVVNAFALPGGYVYVTRGLLALANTEAEVAGVLAHEIGHITERHTAERVDSAAVANIASVLLGAVTGSQELAQIGQVIGAGALAQYSQSQEHEADLSGVKYMSRVGFNPLAQADFLSSLNREHRLSRRLAGRGGAGPTDSFFASHPNTLERVRRARKAALKKGGRGRYGRAALLRRINGLIWGDSPEHGYINRRRFSHPKLRFTFEAPAGFKLVNQPDTILAQGPNGASVRFDQASRPRYRRPAAHIQHEWAAKARIGDLERIEVNGMDAATARTRLKTRNGTLDARLVAIRAADGVLYRFLFLSPPRRSAALARPFRRMTHSFRRLSRREAQRLKPLRIRVFSVGTDDTAARLARLMRVPDNHEARFRVLNALPPSAELRPGDKVKIVTD